MADGTASSDRQRRTARLNAEADIVMLVLSTTVILLSTLISPDPHTLALFGWEIPPLCVWSNLTGWDCFGCGLTRSFTYMGHLMPLAAFDMHKVGPVLWVMTLLNIPWRLRLLWQFRRLRQG